LTTSRLRGYNTLRSCCSLSFGRRRSTAHCCHTMHTPSIGLFDPLFAQRVHSIVSARMQSWKKEWEMFRPHFVGYSTSLFSACLLMQTDFAAIYYSWRLNPWTLLLCPELYASLCLARNVAVTFCGDYTQGYRLFLPSKLVDSLEYIIPPEKPKDCLFHVALESAPEKIRAEMRTIIDRLAEHCVLHGVNPRQLSYTCLQTTSPDGIVEFRLSLCALSREAFECLGRFREMQCRG